MSQLNLFSSSFQVLITDNTRTDDNWVNATKWCEHFGKQWSQIAKQPTFKKFMKALQVKLSSGTTDKITLVKSINRGRAGSQTWIHPLVAIKLLQWLAPNYLITSPQEIAIKMKNEDPDFIRELLICITQNSGERISEKTIQIALAKTINGSELEVCTPIGKIDILTSTELIEVKEWKNWKGAVGQVICYGDYYPSHKKRIHLFGHAHSDFIDLVVKHCKKHSINVTWE